MTKYREILRLSSLRLCQQIVAMVPRKRLIVCLSTPRKYGGIMERIKKGFTNYIHKIIDQTNMSYVEGFNFAKLRNCLAKENTLLRENIFDEKLYIVQSIINKINLSEAKKIIFYRKGDS